MNDLSADGSAAVNRPTWWGRFKVAKDDAISTRVGPLSLTMTRHAREWRIETTRDDEASPDEPRRYVFENTDGVVHLTPRLAERPVVMRPLSPLSIAPGAHIEIHVSSPVMVEIAVGDPAIVLEEFFVARPSDTWFGRSTRTGMLCYASRTRARLDLDELQAREDRVTTSVQVSNQSTEALKLDRLALPTPNLGVFADAGGSLYTEDITLTRKDDEELATLTLAIGPPPHASDAEPLAVAREPRERHTLFQAFGGMFQ